MQQTRNCLSSQMLIFPMRRPPYDRDWHRTAASKGLRVGFSMGRFATFALSGIFLTVSVFAGSSPAQTPSQNMVSTGKASPSSDVTREPVTEDSDIAIDPASLLPDLPSLPPAKASLIGGTIQKLDRVRDEMTVQIFGGGKMKISFDPRTHIYLGTNSGSTSDLHPGDRVYVDTILDGATVFAKSIRLKNTAVNGESQGIVVSYRADRDELLLRDVLSPRPLKVRITPQTQIGHGDHSSSTAELVPGTLVALKFGSQADGRDVASTITVLAVPGSTFTFAGRVTAINLRLGLIVLTSSTDHKTYEIYFDPDLLQPDQNLREAAQVNVLARFDGNRYFARSVTVNPSNP
jgi:hypothetical protein